VVFTEPIAAVQAAVDAQRALAAEPWPAGAEVRVRIGVHTGIAVAVGQTYVGIEVHRAARIAAAGHGGQTLVSDVTARAVSDALADGVTLRDLGRHRLKDIGPQRLFQLDAAGSPMSFPPLRSLEAHPTNLPAVPTPLVDRTEEADALRSMLGETPVLTVTGPGGIGKTRLALAVAESLVDGYPDGVAYLDLAMLDTAAAAADELASVLDLRVPADRSSADAIAEHLRNRDLLLVLDTVDRTHGLAAVLGRWIRECRAVRILATGRSPLRVGGERVVPLGPLPLPPAGAPIAEIAEAPAVRLFLDRARAARPDLELTPSTASAITEICARLDGLPLAIELAAARSRVLAPEALLTRLARRLPLLTGGPRDAPARQQTLRDTIAWSVDGLEEAQRTVLARLSVLAGPFELATAEAIIGEDLDGTDALAALEALLDQSLLATSTASDGRFHLLSTIREYAGESLEATGEANATRMRHAHWFADRAATEQAALQSAEALEATRRIDLDLEDYRAALGWCTASEGDQARGTLGLLLAAALGRYWWLRGRLAEGVRWLDEALARMPPAVADPATRARALLWAGICHDALGHYDMARDLLEASLEATEGLDDARMEAQVRNSLGVVMRSLGDLDRASQLVASSLATKRELGDEVGVATGLNNLGIFAIDNALFEDARGLLEEAVAIDRAAGNEVGVAYSLMPYGSSLVGLGRLDEGERAIIESLATFVELEDTEAVADGLTWLARVAVERGDIRRAAGMWLAARSMRSREALPERPSGDLFAMVEAAVERLDPASMAALTAEAEAVDVTAALALAREPGADPGP
jgi:predicted ATPase